MARTLSIVMLAWWFLFFSGQQIAGSKTVQVVGPFIDRAECDRIRAEIETFGLQSSCWEGDNPPAAGGPSDARS